MICLDCTLPGQRADAIGTCIDCGAAVCADHGVIRHEPTRHDRTTLLEELAERRCLDVHDIWAELPGVPVGM